MNPKCATYFLQSLHGHLSLVHFLILSLKTAREFSSFKSLGMSSQIFGAREEILSVP